MPRRKPYGLIFWPTAGSPLLPRRVGGDRLDDDGDVTGALADAVRTTLSTRAETLQRRSLVHVGLTDHESVGVELEVVRRVGDSAVKHLAHGLARGLRCEVQDRLRLRCRQATDQ